MTAPATARHRVRAIAVLTGVFIAGVLCGLAAYRIASPPRIIRQVSVRVAPRGAAAYEALGLSPDQRRRIDSITQAIQPRTDSLLGDALPRLKALVVSADRAIREQLTPDQRRRLDSLSRIRVDTIDR